MCGQVASPSLGGEAGGRSLGFISAEFVLPRANWSRPLPWPLSILDDGEDCLLLSTLGDIGDFLKRLPKDHRHFDTWQVVNQRLNAAAAGGSLDDMLIALQMALSLEGVEYR